MTLELDKANNTNAKIDPLSFFQEFDKCSSKKELVLALLKILNSLLPVSFLSFVEKEGADLKVLHQLGESDSVKNYFSNEMCQQIYDWVITQQKIASLKLEGKHQFLFLPFIDDRRACRVNHGIAVLHVASSKFELNKELNTTLKFLSKLSSILMSQFANKEETLQYMKLKEELSSELKAVGRIQRLLSNNATTKKILFSVLDDEESIFNGTIWWLNELDPDITLVLMAQIPSSGTTSAMIAGYILGLMNILKSKAEISLLPAEVLRYLNQQLNIVFKNCSITVNAWYGVFNLGARKVRFANANHPAPFLIGPEQQVSNLVGSSNIKDNPLGQSFDSKYLETTSYISRGAKLVICTKDLVEHASNIGHKYDPAWLPQILETLGNLPVYQMRNTLKSILSENLNGTAKNSSRLALLLEIPT